MDWLKIVKIKIIFLAFCLSSLCFGEDTKTNEFENLLSAVKMAKFAKFKSLYSESSISDVQKAELIKMANDIIEIQEKNWPKPIIGKGPSFWGDISNVRGIDLKKKIRITYGILCLGILSYSAVAGCFGMRFIDPLIVGIKNFSWGLAALSIGNHAIPTGFTAAQVGSSWQSQKKCWF